MQTPVYSENHFEVLQHSVFLCVFSSFVNLHILGLYRCGKKVAPPLDFLQFSQDWLGFQGEILHTYVVIICVHIGINSI